MNAPEMPDTYPHLIISKDNQGRTLLTASLESTLVTAAGEALRFAKTNPGETILFAGTKTNTNPIAYEYGDKSRRKFTLNLTDLLQENPAATARDVVAAVYSTDRTAGRNV